ncbi:hypothetical protein [Coxiella-like endosymbiont]|uniref:hypothetical protein n=1 Tax=Coxiella-like endosymbiont TaxID=1592897 RepID=UPI00272C0BA8|nr:hypothetical protein [Coxiella-like endosymbiont]
MVEPALTVSMMNSKSITYDYPVQPWDVYFTASLFFFFECVQLNMFNVLGPDLMRDFHIRATCLGHLSANYFYANVRFSVSCWDALFNRVSTRKVIILAMAASIVCTFGFAVSTSIWQVTHVVLLPELRDPFCLLSNVCLASDGSSLVRWL